MTAAPSGAESRLAATAQLTALRRHWYAAAQAAAVQARANVVGSGVDAGSLQGRWLQTVPTMPDGGRSPN